MRRVIAIVLVLVLVLCFAGASSFADAGPFARASHSGTCIGDFGTECSHVESANPSTATLSMDLRVLATQAGLIPADGFTEGRASLGVDRAMPAGAQTVEATVVVSVTRAEILRRNGLLAPPLWTDVTPSSIRLLFRATADGCECPPVERVVAVEGGVPALGTVTVVLPITGGAPVVQIDVLLIGLARLSHDVGGSPSFPDKGSVRTQAQVTVDGVTLAAA